MRDGLGHEVTFPILTFHHHVPIHLELIEVFVFGFRAQLIDFDLHLTLEPIFGRGLLAISRRNVRRLQIIESGFADIEGVFLAHFELSQSTSAQC